MHPRAMRFAVALALSFAVFVLPVSAQAPRPGVQLRFATLGSTGGLQGSAFLPIAPSDVRLVPRDATCPNTRVQIKARGLRGLVRELRFTLPDVASAGDLTIGAACTEAQLKAKLEDGTEVEGTGTLRIIRVDRTGPVKLELDLEWSPRVRGQALPMTGHVVVPAPPAPTP